MTHPFTKDASNCGACSRTLHGPVPFCPYCGEATPFPAAPGPAAPRVRTRKDTPPTPPEAPPDPQSPPPGPHARDAAEVPPLPEPVPPPQDRSAPSVPSDASAEDAQEISPRSDKAQGKTDSPSGADAKAAGKARDAAPTAEAESKPPQKAAGRGESAAPRRQPMPLWMKIVGGVLVALAISMLFKGQSNSDTAKLFQAAQASYAQKDLTAAQHDLELLLARQSNHADARSLLQDVQGRLQRVDALVKQSEAQLAKGALSKAQGTAQAALAEDHGSREAQGLLARIEGAMRQRAACADLKNQFQNALAMEDDANAQQIIAKASAAGCPEAESLKVLFANRPDKPAPTPPRRPPPPPSPKEDSSPALMELAKAMQLVKEGNWKMGREKAQSVRALAGKNPVVNAAVNKVLRAAEKERQEQANATIIN